MNIAKRHWMAFAGTALLSLNFCAAALADSVGYVDIEKIYKTYDRYQEFAAEANVKKADFDRLKADYTKQIEEAKKNSPKNPVAATQLENDLVEKLKAEFQKLQDWATSQQKSMDASVESAIRDVRTVRKVDVVLLKQVVFEGGVDITNDVLAKLNAAGVK